MYKLLLYVIFLLFCQCKRDHSLKEEVTDLLRTEIVIRGDKALAEEPVTITAYRAERSAGGIHDFYSEGDYWWPNPINPDSAYIRRDGQTLCCSPSCHDPLQFAGWRLDLRLAGDERREIYSASG